MFIVNCCAVKIYLEKTSRYTKTVSLTLFMAIYKCSFKHPSKTKQFFSIQTSLALLLYLLRKEEVKATAAAFSCLIERKHLNLSLKNQFIPAMQI